MRRRVAFSLVVASGRPPGCAFATRRWTVLEPMSSTPSLIATQYRGPPAGMILRMTPDSSALQLSLYRDIPRAEWARLAKGMAQPLTEQEIVQIRGLGDRLDVTEVRDVYLPISRLLSAWARGTRQIGSEVGEFLGEKHPQIPFVVGVAGSVAVGKSTVARLLRELMS